MHALIEYLWMLGDPVRVAAYTRAIQSVVRRGDRVIDLGAGFGYFSVVAARAGAQAVDAIEVNPVVHLGQRVAEANACADVIRFHAADATQIDLPPADVLIADLRRQTPFSRQSLATLINVRDRLLRPGGVIVAARDRLMIAPAAAPRAFQRDVQALRTDSGVDLSAVGRVAYDTPLPYHIEPEALAAQAEEWGAIEYASVQETGLAGTASWTLATERVIDGLALWFESELAPGVQLSSAPGAPGHTYGQLFLAFQAPAMITAGARVRARIAARATGADYVWEWDAWVEDARGTHQIASQNSLAERVLDPAALAAVNRRGDCA